MFALSFFLSRARKTRFLLGVNKTFLSPHAVNSELGALYMYEEREKRREELMHSVSPGLKSEREREREKIGGCV